VLPTCDDVPMTQPADDQEQPEFSQLPRPCGIPRAMTLEILAEQARREEEEPGPYLVDTGHVASSLGSRAPLDDEPLARRGLNTKSLAEAEADGDICIMRAESADTLREQTKTLEFMLASGELTDPESEQSLRDLAGILERIAAYETKQHVDRKACGPGTGADVGGL
jgi:hypothetical protein